MSVCRQCHLFTDKTEFNTINGNSQRAAVCVWVNSGIYLNDATIHMVSNERCRWILVHIS